MRFSARVMKEAIYLLLIIACLLIAKLAFPAPEAAILAVSVVNFVLILKILELLEKR